MKNLALYNIAAVLSWFRLQPMLDDNKNWLRPIVTGVRKLLQSYADGANIFSYPCEVSDGSVVINNSKTSIPAHQVGVFAVALAVISNPKTIYTVGFDGIIPSPFQVPPETIVCLLQTCLLKAD